MAHCMSYRLQHRLQIDKIAWIISWERHLRIVLVTMVMSSFLGIWWVCFHRYKEVIYWGMHCMCRVGTNHIPTVKGTHQYLRLCFLNEWTYVLPHGGLFYIASIQISSHILYLKHIDGLADDCSNSIANADVCAGIRLHDTPHIYL